MTIALVTGGAGLIGSHLVEELLQQEWQVRVLDNLSTGKKENLTGMNVELVVGDVRDRELVGRAMEGVRWVFHQAAMVSVPGSLEDPVTCYEVNLLGSLNVLRAARKAQVKRVVLASSAALYGESDQATDENSPKAPQSPYAASKLAMEQAARTFTELYELETVCLRYFNVYGPRQARDSAYAAVIPAFIEGLLHGSPPTIFGSGIQSRDFIYVADVARANLLAANAIGASGRVFNIASGQTVSVLELLEELRAFIPGGADASTGPTRPGDINFSQAEIDLATEVLGFRPSIELESGLQQTVDWMRNTIQTPQAQD